VEICRKLGDRAPKEDCGRAIECQNRQQISIRVARADECLKAYDWACAITALEDLYRREPANPNGQVKLNTVRTVANLETSVAKNTQAGNLGDAIKKQQELCQLISQLASNNKCYQKLETLKVEAERRCNQAGETLPKPFYLSDIGEIVRRFGDDCNCCKDLIEKAKANEAARDRWQKYQLKMKTDFDGLRANDERDFVKPQERVEAWQLFANAYNDDNPFTSEDEDMRAEAKRAIERWRSYPADVWVDRKTEMQFVWVPPGEFDMGCITDDALCDPDENPKHRVRISKGFWLGRTEVTVAQFRRFVEGSAYMPTGQMNASAGLSWDKPGFAQGPDHPGVFVNWSDAMAFCRWTGFRLPTEAEWEYAARGGRAGWKYTWGPDMPPVRNGRAQANVVDETAKRNHPGWTTISGYDDGYSETSPVGKFESNGYGLCDMSGDVWEWCQDWYDSNWYTKSVTIDPQGPDVGSSRVIRGGAWNYTPYGLRVSNREWSKPESRTNNIGFRCVRDASTIRDGSPR
jgi:formylglycine-generating enzyme required for sulfatase activity